MDRLACIVGKFTTAKDIFKLGFNRIKNSEGPRTAPKKRWAHSADNIEVRLTILNTAMNRFDESVLVGWFEGLRSHTETTTTYTAAATLEQIPKRARIARLVD